KDNHLEHQYSITFYGPINDEDKDYFNNNIAKYSFAEYKGALQPAEIYDTLSKYDVMLLPTHYYTEGLPGSVVDAYISGIPVIVTEWKHAREFVEDSVSGFIIPFENGQNELIDKVQLLDKDRKLLHQLQANALKKRMEFAPPVIDELVCRGGY
ncbi:MAG: glycosyltransferase, partial [Candidatus Cryptobacteroides sp.]